jgi:hypothetical protein
LDLDNLEGLHVAFTAGTGSLVFVDLVARIFLQNYSKLYAREHKDLKQKLLNDLTNAHLLGESSPEKIN